MTEEIKAATEIAKTTGKAIDATREFGGFISRFIVGPIEQGIGIFEDKLKYMRWENQVAIMDKVNRKMAERGLEFPTQAVPLKIAIPLLQAASLEDDDNLQELWANLLVNASDKKHHETIKRTYISILEDLTWLDVQIIQTLYSVEFGYPDENEHVLGTEYLPDGFTEMGIKDLRRSKEQLKGPSDEVALALENLCRLRLLNSAMPTNTTPIKAVYKTTLGKSLYRACSIKESSTEAI